MKKLFKAIFYVIPFKRQIFSLIKTFHPPKRIYQHLYFKGIFKARIDNISFKMVHYGFDLENDLFWRGSSEPVSISLWKRLCEKSSFIFDVGANTGIYSLVASAVSPSANIYAFEPVQRVFNKLEKNIEINNFNVKAFEIAISDTNGQTFLYDNTEEHNYTASLNKNHRPGSEQKIIKAQTLDSFISEYGIKAELVKIDVERYEPAVIRGFMETIKRDMPTLLIEILDNEIGEAVGKELSGLPYAYFSISETHGIRRVESLSKSDDYNYLICNETVVKELRL